MKKILLVAVIALLGWVVYQRVETGKWSLLPVHVTAQEAELQRLEAELSDVEAKIAAQSRTAGMAGVEAPLSLTDLEARRDTLRAQIEKAKAGLAK